MKTFRLIAIFACSTLLLSGCIKTSQPSNTLKTSASQSKNTTIEGTLIKTNSGFAIRDTQKKITTASSYKLDLTPYAGKTIKATGQFSGDTLYIDSIE